MEASEGVSFTFCVTVKKKKKGGGQCQPSVFLKKVCMYFIELV